MKNLLVLFFVLMVVTVFNGLTLNVDKAINLSLDNDLITVIAQTTDEPDPAVNPDRDMSRTDPFAIFGNSDKND